MNRKPDETSCDWARERLPLLAGGDDPAPSRDDRPAVEAHLASCAACRSRRDGLGRALEALAAAAEESPVEPHAPSLWPALQARIEAQARAAASDRRARRRPTTPRPATIPVAAAAPPASPARGPLRKALAGPLVATAAAAALAAVAVGLPAAGSLRSRAEARIARASAPIPVASPPLPLVLTPATAPPFGPGLRADAAPAVDLEADQLLARNTEPIRPDLPADIPSDAGPAPTPAVRFDLERGTPMPPDSRIDKPAY